MLKTVSTTMSTVRKHENENKYILLHVLSSELHTIGFGEAYCVGGGRGGVCV